MGDQLNDGALVENDILKFWGLKINTVYKFLLADKNGGVMIKPVKRYIRPFFPANVPESELDSKLQELFITLNEYGVTVDGKPGPQHDGVYRIGGGLPTKSVDGLPVQNCFKCSYCGGIFEKYLNIHASIAHPNVSTDSMNAIPILAQRMSKHKHKPYFEVFLETEKSNTPAMAIPQSQIPSITSDSNPDPPSKSKIKIKSYTDVVPELDLFISTCNPSSYLNACLSTSDFEIYTFDKSSNRGNNLFLLGKEYIQKMHSILDSNPSIADVFDGISHVSLKSQSDIRSWVQILWVVIQSYSPLQESTINIKPLIGWKLENAIIVLLRVLDGPEIKKPEDSYLIIFHEFVRALIETKISSLTFKIFKDGDKSKELPDNLRDPFVFALTFVYIKEQGSRALFGPLEIFYFASYIYEYNRVLETSDQEIANESLISNLELWLTTETQTPFSFSMQMRAVTQHKDRIEKTFERCEFINSNEVIKYKDSKLSLDEAKGLIDDLIFTWHELLKNRLAKDIKVPLPEEAIKEFSNYRDVIDCNDDGYSFIDDPANNFKASFDTTDLEKFALDSQSKWLDICTTMHKTLFTLISLISYPSINRLRECALMTYRNAKNDIRNLYLTPQGLYYVLNIDEASEAEKPSNKILNKHGISTNRIIPPLIARMIIYTLAYIRPIEFKLLEQSKTSTFSQYLFFNKGGKGGKVKDRTCYSYRSDILSDSKYLSTCAVGDLTPLLDYYLNCTVSNSVYVASLFDSLSYNRRDASAMLIITNFLKYDWEKLLRESSKVTWFTSLPGVDPNMMFLFETVSLNTLNVLNIPLSVKDINISVNMNMNKKDDTVKDTKSNIKNTPKRSKRLVTLSSEEEETSENEFSTNEDKDGDNYRESSVENDANSDEDDNESDEPLSKFVVTDEDTHKETTPNKFKKMKRLQKANSKIATAEKRGLGRLTQNNSVAESVPGETTQPPLKRLKRDSIPSLPKMPVLNPSNNSNSNVNNNNKAYKLKQSQPAMSLPRKPVMKSRIFTQTKPALIQKKSSLQKPPQPLTFSDSDKESNLSPVTSPPSSPIPIPKMNIVPQHEFERSADEVFDHQRQLLNDISNTRLAYISFYNRQKIRDAEREVIKEDITKRINKMSSRYVFKLIFS